MGKYVVDHGVGIVGSAKHILIKENIALGGWGLLITEHITFGDGVEMLLITENITWGGG